MTWLSEAHLICSHNLLLEWASFFRCHGIKKEYKLIPFSGENRRYDINNLPFTKIYFSLAETFYLSAVFVLLIELPGCHGYWSPVVYCLIITSIKYVSGRIYDWLQTFLGKVKIQDYSRFWVLGFIVPPLPSWLLQIYDCENLMAVWYCGCTVSYTILFLPSIHLMEPDCGQITSCCR